MTIGTSLLIATVLVALTFDVLNGFHDAANSIATVVSTGVLSPRTAVLWAAFFNFVAMFVFAPNVANTIAIQTNGKILLGGSFTTVNGVSRSYLARLNADGSVDNGFLTNSYPDGTITCVALQADGSILLGGNFGNVWVGGTPTLRNRIARLNADGTLDPSFNPNLNSTVNSIAARLA